MITPEVKREIAYGEIKRNQKALERIKEELWETVFRDSLPEYGVSGCEVIDYEAMGRYWTGPVIAEIRGVDKEGHESPSIKICVGYINPDDGKPLVMKFEELKPPKK